MEGLKLIAQSTFDRHQKFRPSSGASGEGRPYRYNVIEVGAFGSPQQANNNSNTTPTAAAFKRHSIGSGNVQNVVAPGGAGSRQNGSAAAGAGSRVMLNEWMVYEDDLGAFMKKRPIQVVAPGSPSAEQAAPPQAATQNGVSGPATGTTSSTGGLSRSLSSPSSKMTATTSATTATTTGASAGVGNATRRDITQGKDEVEAVASLKLVCIQLAAALDDAANVDVDSNTLAISREVFLRLYVDIMDADHCALYYLAREYDGFHEFNDQHKGIVTKFVGTSDYALVWTFNRRTLETRGLFLDRCQRWQAKDAGVVPMPVSNAPAGGRPVTPVKKMAQGDATQPSTPSKKWTKNRTGTVSASEAWQGFRETLNMYRGYVFAPQLLSFVSCVHMLRSFDDQVNGDDLPLLKNAETSIPSIALGQATITTEESNGPGGGVVPTQQTLSSFAVVPEQNPFAPATPPDEAEKPGPAPQPARLARQRLLAQTLATSRVDTRLANKVRHLRTARAVLEAIAREHETVIVDVVAPEFLDRYHWAMEGLNEAIPALERHVASLEEYLRYLKGRSERLSGTLISALAGPSRARGPTAVEAEKAEGEERFVLPPPVRSGPPMTGRAAVMRRSDVNNPAVVILASIPAIFSAGIIAIVSLRWSIVVPCVVVVFYGWVTVRQREWLLEVLGSKGWARIDRPGFEHGRGREGNAVDV